MEARKLRELLTLVRRLQDRVLYEISSVPEYLHTDFEDKAIVAVARGERERRNTE